MKKTITFLSLLLLSAAIFAQQQYVSYYFNQLEIKPCPADSNTMVTTFKNCEIYQTLDNTWYGVKDSTVCLNVAMVNNTPKLKLLGAEPTRKVFIHWVLPDSEKILLRENGVGTFSFLFQTDTGLHLATKYFCSPIDTCTHIEVGISIPSSTSSGNNMRWYDLAFHNTSNWQGISSYLVESCIPTEKFVNGNYLQEAIISFAFNDNNIANHDISLGSIAYNIMGGEFFSGGYIPVRDTIVDIVSTSTHHYSKSLYEIYYPLLGQTYMVMYEDSTYPAPNNISFVDFGLNPNPSTQDTLDILVFNSETIVFQPFVSIRGGYVAGGTDRHIVNLYNNGANLCFPGFIDLNILPNNGYTHNAGNIEFQDYRACMMLNHDAFIKVPENGYLHYGREGRGMLGVQTDAKIILERNATLVFDGKMVLIPLASDTERHDLEIVLPVGSKFTFTQNAEIVNKCVVGFGRKIKIYMKGGTLDMSALNENARQHIEVIYDEKPKTMEDNVVILGNPVNEELVFQYIDDNIANLNLILYNLSGQSVYNQSYNTQKGVNEFTLKMENLPVGIYLAKFQTSEGEVVRRIWKN